MFLLSPVQAYTPPCGSVKSIKCLRHQIFFLILDDLLDDIFPSKALQFVFINTGEDDEIL